MVENYQIGIRCIDQCLDFHKLSLAQIVPGIRGFATAHYQTNLQRPCRACEILKLGQFIGVRSGIDIDVHQHRFFAALWAFKHYASRSGHPLNCS